MQCENAYIKEGVRYILCKKEKEPDLRDQRALTHAMCGHQRFCPNIRACTLLPSWEHGLKRAENQAQVHGEAAENAAGGEKPARTAKKKSALKASEEGQE